MATITIGFSNARKVRRLLNAVATTPGVPSDVRANTAYWATAVRRRMDRRDLQTAAWILLDASSPDPPLSRPLRRQVRYCAAQLEASC